MNGRITAAIALLFAAVFALAQEPPAPVPAPAQQPANHDEFTQEVYFGKQFSDMKDYAAAYKHFANADALQPDNPGVLYNMGVLLAKAGRYSEAQSKVDRYNQLYPNGAEKALIRSLQLALNFQRELQKQRQAEQSYSDLFTRGGFFYSRNDLAVALKQFQDAEQQRPADAAAVFNQAVIFEKMGDFAKAAERFHRYADLEADTNAKTSAQQRLLLLESEIEDMKVKIVCAFCGFRLHLGALWCPRCWHGPYLTAQPVWSSRPCVEGASATRTTYASGNFAKNDTLPCLFDGSLREALRYSPAKQRMIQDARKAEGWTYNGEIIQGLRDQLRYAQGPEYLERIVAPATGETLNFVARKSGETWLLEREETVIDGIKFTSRYSFDAQNRITQQIVDYQNTAGCNHLINMAAAYKYNGDAFAGATIHGGYEGFQPEGAPKMDWVVNVAETYDANGRVTREDVALTSMEKKYMSKPVGKLRDELSTFYDGWHVNQPIANIMTKGDICALSGSSTVGNLIDLRPFYAMSPNLGMVLPLGVTKASIALTYPDSFSAR